MERDQCMEDCNPTAIAAVKAINEPTEISNPPPIITKVDPIAIIPTIELCLKTLIMFLQDMKLGVRKDIIIINNKKAKSSLYFPPIFIPFNLKPELDIFSFTTH